LAVFDHFSFTQTSWRKLFNVFIVKVIVLPSSAHLGIELNAINIAVNTLTLSYMTYAIATNCAASGSGILVYC